jgi:transcriptional regulator with XRE-family HTH domain
MTFGERVRELRKAKGLTLRRLAPRVGVGYTYLSRVENGRLNYGDYPSETLIHKLAEALNADEDELLILAEKIPERIRRRMLERPEAFRRFAELDDASMDRVLKQMHEAKM